MNILQSLFEIGCLATMMIDKLLTNVLLSLFGVECLNKIVYETGSKFLRSFFGKDSLTIRMIKKLLISLFGGEWITKSDQKITL
jgi:hypothetical protein